MDRDQTEPAPSVAQAREAASWWWPGALLVGLVVAWFSPWLLFGQVLAPFDIVHEMLNPWRADGLMPLVHNHFVTDAVTQYLPYRLLAARSFFEDGWVGWNPLLFGGTAQSANTMALSYDWTTQLYRFLDFWQAWHLGRIGQFLVAGFGMLLFLRGRGCKPGVAALGAVAYMMNIQFVTWIYHQWALASFCWMPWLLWALYAARERSVRFVAAGAVFLALSLLGATLQHAVFVLLALSCIWLGWLREGGWPNFARGTAVLFLVGLLGSGLAAFALEPAVSAYLENLLTGHSRGGLGYELGPWQPLLNILALPFTAFPFLLGSVQTLDLGKLFMHSYAGLGFFGTVPVLLAVVSLFSRRVPTAAKWLMLAGIVVPLTPLVGPLYHRVNLLWILGGCWGCCSWLAAANQVEIKRMASLLWRGLALITAAWLLASIGMVIGQPWLEPALLRKVSGMAASSQFGMFAEWMETRAGRLLPYLCVWNPWQIAALAGAGLSVWGLAWLGSPRAWGQLASALGVAVQLSVFWLQWTTWSCGELPYEKPALVTLLQGEVGSIGRLSGVQRSLPDDLLASNMLMPSGVAITGGYDSIHPRRMTAPSQRPWDFPGTTHHLGKMTETTPENWAVLWTLGEWAVWRNPAPSFGVIRMMNGQEMPVPAASYSRPTLYTMTVSLPTGSRSVELFSNWNRGWKWRAGDSGVWTDTVAGRSGGVLVELAGAPNSATVAQLRFDSTPLGWVLFVTTLSGACLVAIVLLPSRLCCCGNKRGARRSLKVAQGGELQ